MTSTPEKDFTGKTGKKYAVWLGKSNRWVSLEEPAFFVYRSFAKGMPEKNISLACKKKYALGKDDSIRFVSEITGLLKTYRDSAPDPLPYTTKIFDTLPESQDPVSFSYCINKRIISVVYGNETLAYYFHPLLKRFECGEHGQSAAEFRIFSENKKLLFFRPGCHNEAYVFSEIPPLKRYFYMALSFTIYQTRPEDWSAFIHGSAINSGRNAIILSSLTGSGKSTLAALLMSRGHRVMTDDFIPLNGRTGRIYPLPVALSIKNVAVPVLKPFFSGLPDSNYRYGSLSSASSFLLPNAGSSNLAFRSALVKNFVFLSYDPGKKLALQKLPPDEALRLFIINSSIQAQHQSIERFFRWFKKITFWSLSYPDPLTAAGKIEGLLVENK